MIFLKIAQVLKQELLKLRYALTNRVNISRLRSIY